MKLFDVNTLSNYIEPTIESLSVEVELGCNCNCGVFSGSGSGY